MYKLVLEGLSKNFKEKKAVDSLSLSLSHGVYGLLGENGAGKTTTFYMIVGLVKANSGTVSLLNKETNETIDMTKMPMNERAKLGVGYLPQEASIFRKLSVEDNLKLVLELNDKLDKNHEKRKIGT